MVVDYKKNCLLETKALPELFIFWLSLEKAIGFMLRKSQQWLKALDIKHANIMNI